MADFNEYKGVWVFCEQRQGALMSTDFELVSEARKLADELGCEVTGLLLGDHVEPIAKETGRLRRRQGHGLREPPAEGLHHRRLRQGGLRYGQRSTSRRCC